MCPICLSAIGWIAVSGGAGTGVVAALIVGLKKTKAKEENDVQSFEPE